MSSFFATTLALVTFFEIPVVDMDRAVSFYEAVFDVRLETATIDGNEMAFFPEGGDDTPGASGALAKGESYQPSENGSRLYFYVKDIETVLARVRKHGGRIVYPRTAIGELGWVAEFHDSEGNRIALHQPSTN